MRGRFLLVSRSRFLSEAEPGDLDRGFPQRFELERRKAMVAQRIGDADFQIRVAADFEIARIQNVFTAQELDAHPGFSRKLWHNSMLPHARASQAAMRTT
jgi:hypothetical protein